jgi:hypothetical protein
LLRICILNKTSIINPLVFLLGSHPMRMCWRPRMSCDQGVWLLGTESSTSSMYGYWWENRGGKIWKWRSQRDVSNQEKEIPYWRKLREK